MGYDSQIAFTIDTICPWTYLAKRRLAKALDIVRSSPGSADVTFTVKYFPFQLYPEATQEGEDKYEWYKRKMYGGSDLNMKMYTTLMSSYGSAEGIDYKYGGTVANTLNAHRLIQHFQKEKGPDVADKIVSSLYRQYFEEEKHPSSRETLLTAATEAGIDEKEAKELIDHEDQDVSEVKALIREQARNDIDAVPYVVVEGKKRDFRIDECRDVDDYVKILEQVVKEST